RDGLDHSITRGHLADAAVDRNQEHVGARGVAHERRIEHRDGETGTRPAELTREHARVKRRRLGRPPDEARTGDEVAHAHRNPSPSRAIVSRCTSLAPTLIVPCTRSRYS